MRLARPLFIALLTGAAAGCLHPADQPPWLDPVPLLSQDPAADTAYVEYVLVERTAGGEEINRRVWDRIDEQVFPFEVRTVLEEAGLRVGIASQAAPGLLRPMIDDPRTDRGHRYRTFALEKPAPLLLSGSLARAEFGVPAARGGTVRFTRDAVALGFALTIRDAADGKVAIRLVPHARYHDPNRLVPAANGERDHATEDFPGAAFEIALAPAEYLVIGTDWYWDSTFGHTALTGQTDERTVQRLLVLRAGRNKSQAGGLALPTGAGAPPLAAQATTARGYRP
jgi:hypothetical protein